MKAGDLAVARVPDHVRDSEQDAEDVAVEAVCHDCTSATEDGEAELEAISSQCLVRSAHERRSGRERDASPSRLRSQLATDEAKSPKLE